MKMSLSQCLHEIGTNYPEMADAVRCVSAYGHLFRVDDAETDGQSYFTATLDGPLRAHHQDIVACRATFYPAKVHVFPFRLMEGLSWDFMPAFVCDHPEVCLLETFEYLLQEASDRQSLGIWKNDHTKASTRRRRKTSRR